MHISCTNIPQFYPNDLELRALVAERLVAESGAGRGDAVLEVRVEPEAVMSISEIKQLIRFELIQKTRKGWNLPSTNTQIPRLAKDHIIINTGIRKGFEPYSIGCTGSVPTLSSGLRWAHGVAGFGMC